MPLQTILLGLLPPVLVAAVVVAAAWLLRGTGRKSPPRWAGAVALALAYAVADTLVAGGLPVFPPSESHRLLPFAGLAAAAMAFLPAGRSERLRCVLTFGVAAACFAWMLRDELSGTDTRPLEKGAVVLAFGWLLVHSVFAGSLPAVAAGATGGGHGVRMALSMLVSAVGASLVFLQSYSALYALMAGAIAAVAAAFLALAWWRPEWEVPRWAAPVHGLLLAGLSLSLSLLWSRLFVLAGALAPGLANTRLAQRLPGWLLTTLCALVAAGLCTLAVWESPAGFDFGGY